MVRRASRAILRSCPGCAIHPPPSEETPLEVPIFADISPQAYGTAFYVFAPGLENRVTSELLISESRVAPINTRTISRLKLVPMLARSKALQLHTKRRGLR